MRLPKRTPNLEFIFKDEKKLTEFGVAFHRDDVKEFVAHANDPYLYWDEVTYRPKPDDIDYKILWAIIKEIRDYKKIVMEISTIPNFIFHYSRTDSILEHLHEFDMNLGGQMTGDSIIPQDEKEKYLISSLMEEAIASSQIEGAATTREVAKAMLQKGRSPKNKSEKMILNNYITIKKILNMVSEELTPEMILDIHTSMTYNTLSDPSHEGSFRNSNDIHVYDKVTDNKIYTPPDFKHLPQLIEDLCTFVNNDNPDTFIHPIIKGTLIHFLIGYIHPFNDGNGRTARAIFYWYLLKRGYWMIEYMSISRTIVRAPSKYARAYLHTEYDENDVTYFINYQLRALKLALNDLEIYIKKQIKKKKTGIYDKLIQLEHINLRQAFLINKIVDKPQMKFTVKEVTNRFNVVYQTARTDLLDLVKKGFFEVEIGSNRQMVFIKSESFDKVLEDQFK